MVLYRTSDVNWFINFLKNKSVVAKPGEYISFSKDKYSGSNFDFGNTTATFNADMISGIDIKYTVEFLMIILKYVYM